MPKRSQPLSFIVEGRSEGFAVVRRDFKVTVENQSSSQITGGIIAAQWADPGKSAEKWVPEGNSTSHVFGPGPSTIVVYLESEDSYWGGIAGVDGYSSLTIKLFDKQ